MPIARAIFLAVATVWLLFGIYFVAADQQAVVLRLGRVAGAPVGPGVHWTWPAPVGKVFKIRARETRRLTVGFAAPDQVLGRDAQPAQAEFLTGDRNLISIGLVTQYAIKDPIAYLFRFGDVESLLRSTVESSLAAVVMRRGVDSLLTTEKVAVQQEVHALAQELVESYGAGVSILGVSLESVAPPEAVREAFNDVASAREDRDRIVREAQSYANEVLPVARGDAERQLRESEGYLESRRQRAAGDAARFEQPRRRVRQGPQRDLDPPLPRGDGGGLAPDGQDGGRLRRARRRSRLRAPLAGAAVAMSDS